MDNKRSERGCYKAEHQKWEPLSYGFQRAVLNSISCIQRSHFINIFSGFLLDNIDDIVNRYYTDKFTFRINHRDGDKIIICNVACHFFLVCFRMNAYDIFSHDIFQRSVGTGKQKLPYGNNPYQMALFIYGVKIESTFDVSFKLHGSYSI